MAKEKKHPSFQVPSNYFEEKENTLKKIAQHPKQKSIIKPLWPWLAAAAALLLALFSWPVDDTSIAPSAAEPSSTEIIAFLEQDKYALHLNASYTANYGSLDTLLHDESLNLSDAELTNYLSEQPLEFYDL